MKVKRYIAYCCLWSSALGISNAQVDSVTLADGYLQQAEQIYKQQKEAVEIAKELFILAADFDPNNLRANWMAGQLYLETINKDRSLPYLMRIFKKKPTYRFDLQYHIGRAYHHGFEFDSAIFYYERYKNKVLNARSYRGRDRVSPKVVSRRILECKNGKEIINSPAQYSIIPLGEEINSPWPDYAPVLNKKGDLMIFTSRRQEENTNADVDKDNFYFEDVFFSTKNENGWSSAKNIGAPINTQYHDANIYLSADGNRLYLYKDTGMGDVFYTDFMDTIWSEPKFLTNKINSSIYSENSLCETSTQDMVFYTSSRPGGIGGIDIYYCIKDDKGNWYKSKSLGPAINTSGNEDSPFLAHDGKTLYFSSTGHAGYGGYDIFKSVYDSLSQQWSVPKNLGYPVNTPDDEISFQTLQDQRIGYYASVREGGIGFSDIFMVKYHGGQPIYPEESEIKMLKEADISVKKTARSYEDFELKIINHTYRIFFDAAQSSIQVTHRSELDSIVQLMNKYEGLRLLIEGYASKDGNPRYNLQLSQKRALIVLSYFLSNGIDEKRISAKGYGSIKDKEGDSEEHRRADVKVVNSSGKKRAEGG